VNEGPITKPATGTVTLPGEAIAMIAEGNFVLRLRVPGAEGERHLVLMRPR